MAITTRASGAWAEFTATGAVTIPGAPVAGDRMFLFATWKDFSVTASVTGWTAIGAEFADGAVATGNGAGSMKVQAWYRDWVTGDSNPTLTFSGGVIATAAIVILAKGATESWNDPGTVTAAWPVTATTQTISASSTIYIPNIAMVYAFIGIRDDSATFTRPVTAIDVASGITWNGNHSTTPGTNFSTTTGNDMAASGGLRSVTTGAVTVTLRVTATISAVETGAIKWIVQALGGQGFSQAQASIKQSDIEGVGQAQADINATTNSFAQAQAQIKQTYNAFAQSQSDIKQTYNAFAQTQAQIILLKSSYAQARAFIIKFKGLAQAAALINGTYFLPLLDTFTRSVTDGLGTSDNGDTWILTSGTAANADVNGSTATLSNDNQVERWNLTKTLISTTHGLEFSGQISADKIPTGQPSLLTFSALSGFANAAETRMAVNLFFSTTAEIRLILQASGATFTRDTLPYTASDTYNFKLQVFPNKDTYSKLWKVGDTEPGWTISSSPGIVANFIPGHPSITTGGLIISNQPITYTFDNFQILEAWPTQYAQAQAKIIAVSKNFAQTQANIKTKYITCGQAQSNIKQIYNNFAQAQAQIKQTYNSFAQAAAYISGQHVLRDTFTRTVSNGWGTPDIGPNWFISGWQDPSLYSVDGTKGKIVIDPSGQDYTYINNQQIDLSNQENSFDFSINALPNSDQIYIFFDSRVTYQANADGFYGGIFTGIQIHSTGESHLSSLVNKDGLGDYHTEMGVSYITIAPNTTYRFKQKSINNANSTEILVFIKIWDLLQPEPEWVSYNSPYVPFGGSIVLETENDSGATNTITFTFDNINAQESNLAGYAQAQAKIDTEGVITSNAFAQTQANIKQTYNAFAQSQAQIKQTYNAFSQAQADIKQTYQAYAQSQAQIKQTYNTFAQSQADIKQTYNAFSQAQADIKATSQGHSQAQADISQTYLGFAQSQADIKATYIGAAQAQARITQTYNSFAQVQAEIKQTYNGYAQAQAIIKQTYQSFAQAQARILGYAFGQTQADIKATYQAYAQTQAKIKQIYNAFAQSQADINATYNAFSQAQAWIEQTYNSFAQAQASIKQTYQGYAQAQARILSTYNQFAQAQAEIKQTYLAFAQAQATILGYAFGQSQAAIKTTVNGFAQAQAKINAFGVQGYAQGQALIKVGNFGYGQAQAKIRTTRQYGQAQAFISKSKGLAQTQARIKQVYQSYAQAQADIKATSRGYAQAQASILSTVNRFAQSQARILQTYNSFAQSQARIKQVYQSYAQAQADIKSVSNGFSQAQAVIRHTYESCANAQGRILTTYNGFAQAQARVLATYSGFAQAQADIRTTINSFAQAQALIKKTSQGYANTQALIIVINVQPAQAQGLIRQTVSTYAQSQTVIKQTYNNPAQAQASIRQTYQRCANAQAIITVLNAGYAQTQGLIKTTSNSYAQAPAVILATYIASAQAQAHISVLTSSFAQAQAYVVSGAGHGQAKAFIKISHYLNTLDILDRESAHLVMTDRDSTEETIEDTLQIGLVLSDRETPNLAVEDVLVIGLTITDRNYEGV